MRNALFILGQLVDQDVEWLISHGTRRRLKAGDTLIRQGEMAAHLYLVLGGTFAVHEAHAPRDVAHLGSGEIVGEMSFVDERAPSATVTAQEEADVLAIPKRDLAAKLDVDTAFAARFYRALTLLLADRLRAAVAGAETDAAEVDELDPAVLDRVHLAGTHFDHILKRATRPDAIAGR